jgi:hypothetical protein
LELIPFLGENRITTDAFRINVDPKDQERVKSLLARSGQVELVNNNDTFAIAKRVGGQLKAMLHEIADSKKAAKRPFGAIETAIEGLATEVAGPVETEHKRVLGLLNSYVEALERAEKEEQRKREAALKAQVAEQLAKLREAQEAQAKAEAEARTALDEAERLKAQEEARRRQEVAEQAELEREMALEVAQIANQPALKKSKVPGGRVDHPLEFTLVSVEAVVKAGNWRLLRWELDKLACADSVRAQREINPDAEPTLPGIKITQRVSVSVRASA